jgi:hypothetical protein
MVRGEQLTLNMIFVIIALVLCSGCVSLKCAFVPDQVLDDGWYENTALRNTGLQVLGLEKWCSVTYEIQGSYPAFLTITAGKSLVLTEEEELQDRIQEIVENNFQENIELHGNSSGERRINLNHQTEYLLYQGVHRKTQNKVKIIGEVWNCGSSGVSIICLGLGYITNEENPGVEFVDNWEKIVQDPTGSIDHCVGDKGLIYTVRCH